MEKRPFYSGKDALGRPVLLPEVPKRIISLVPSQTELLADLGLGERLIGRTRYCIHPKSSVSIVGGTKRVDLELIKKLQPDLIIAEKEENPEEMVSSLAPIAPVYVTDVTSLVTALTMCVDVGEIVDLKRDAEALTHKIAKALVSANGIARQPERVLYLIWKKPWMAAASGTFIHSCLEYIGFENVLAHTTRYPELSPEVLASLKPDRVFLSSEPYPFKENHLDELREIFPRARIELVDGELFSWYGSRMLKMPDYWRGLLT